MICDDAFTRFPRLSTERLLLREPGLHDADALFAILSDDEAMRFYGHAPHRSLDETHQLIAAMHTHYREHTAIHWGITRHGDDTVIGSCSLHNLNADGRHAELGYALRRADWGQGLMSEAIEAVLEFGFMQLDLHRIEAIIDDANTRSKALLLKRGFSYEGRLRERYYDRGRFEDEYYYGLLKHEWLDTRPTTGQS